ncbi:MAG: alkaline phosphatase PafA [Bacteroidota bacterium]
MKLKSLLLSLITVLSLCSSAQPNRPKLVVGMVVDQMRYDYLHRYAAGYGNDGFLRLLREGYSCDNAHFDYVPTYTAPGHACIYTGTSPSQNGIISNEWYDRTLKKGVYCVSDSTVNAVGTTSISGKMSPRRLLSSTITDELMFATNGRSKVIGVSLKDRGSILPSGHSPTGAYWHDSYSNNFVTSTYYMQTLPAWVKAFNERKLVDTLLSKKWDLLLSPDKYLNSTQDDAPYEGKYKGEERPVFPHDLPVLRSTEPELVRRTPMGNTLTLEFAKAAIEGEALGKDNVTDFLAVSLSSTDYVGHQFGINAMETEDTYYRLDRDLAAFLKYLDQTVGQGNYLFFLTADHGACANPAYNADHGLPGGLVDEPFLRDTLEKMLTTTFGNGILLFADAYNVYLDHEVISKKQLDQKAIESACVEFVKSLPGVLNAYPSFELDLSNCHEGVARLVQRGYHPQRSSDINIQLLPGWLDWLVKTGTSHGSPYSYDTHVPVLFFGSGVQAGSTQKPVSVCDIAPTVSAMLKIQSPSACEGTPVVNMFK